MVLYGWRWLQVGGLWEVCLRTNLTEIRCWCPCLFTRESLSTLCLQSRLLLCPHHHLFQRVCPETGHGTRILTFVPFPRSVRVAVVAFPWAKTSARIQTPIPTTTTTTTTIITTMADRSYYMYMHQWSSMPGISSRGPKGQMQVNYSNQLHVLPSIKFRASLSSLFYSTAQLFIHVILTSWPGTAMGTGQGRTTPNYYRTCNSHA